jgi:uncharacterized repeat protein (TIGR03803 family)
LGGSTDGTNPAANVTLDSAGNLYGTALYGGPGGYGIVFQLTPKSNGTWTETILYAFQGAASKDGADPTGGVTFDSEGNLYGTTTYGGSTKSPCPTNGCGTIFKLNHDARGWTENILYEFHDGSDGEYPSTDLVIDTAGNLYGTIPAAINVGNLFELSPASGTWNLTVLHVFAGVQNDGYEPNAVTIDAAGNLFGTTYLGGANSFGVVFEMTPGSGGWQYSVLYTFANTGDGGNPLTGVTVDGSGNIYGTTWYGATGSKNGAVFELSQSAGGGWTESVLYSFAGGTDGSFPGGSPLFVGGNLYGNTKYGGPANAGTIYELAPASGGGWSESVAYSFPATDGSYPFGDLVADSSGNLYGTTSGGGFNECFAYGDPTEDVNCGAVFELTPAANGAWKETILHEFTGLNGDGAVPMAGLIFDSALVWRGWSVEIPRPSDECAWRAG